MNLPDPRSIAPLKAAPAEQCGENWTIAFTTGESSEDGREWCIQTDNVRASETLEYELPLDAKHDAETLVAIVNAYRTGKLVLVS